MAERDIERVAWVSIKIFLKKKLEFEREPPPRRNLVQKNRQRHLKMMTETKKIVGELATQ